MPFGVVPHYATPRRLPSDEPKRVIGVLGGMGPAATFDFARMLVGAVRADRDQQHPRVIVDSDPSVPDRTAFLLGEGESPVPRLVMAAERLKTAGADLLVMPCNTAHAFLPTLRDTVSGVEWIDWPGVVANHLRSMSRKRVHLLATSGTIAAEIYHRPLGEHEIEVSTPADQAGVDHIIRLVKAGRLREAGKLLDHLIEFRDEWDRSVLLGCTELSVIALNWHDVINASVIVANHVTGKALAPAPKEKT